ncbi:MAG TPA: condensation domain-containing protein [Solirubrobacteraceae bacterium]|nr:condensation domain-containing protein [Solirubrobacteraceae bacterium]
MSIRELPASIGQRVLWQMDHHRGGHGALNCPLLIRLRGPLDPDALQAAVDGVARRHESLRTTFTGRGPRLRQLVHDARALEIMAVDLADHEAAHAEVDGRIASEVQARTDPEEEPVRVTLWRLGGEDHVLCLTMHHLVTDGFSTALVCDELGRLYDRILAGGPPLDPVGWQYREWMVWQQEQLTGESLRRLQDYWRERLTGALLPPLPRRDSEVPLLERRTAVQRATIPGGAVRALQRFARARGTAAFTCLLAIYYALLSSRFGAGDFSVGSIFANRVRREAQSTVGFLSNMVVLRMRADPSMTLAELVAAADEAVIGAFAHQALPFQMLPLHTLDPGSMRADSVVFQLFAGPMAPAVRAGLQFEPVIDVPAGIGSRWEFELSAFPAGDELSLLLCFAEDLYDPEWARAFLDAYVELAVRAAAAPSAPPGGQRPGRPRAPRPALARE